MLKRQKRRYIVFEASAGSGGQLTRQDVTHALNAASREMGLEGDDRPWLLIFEPTGQGDGRHLGIFRVPRTRKDLVTGFFSTAKVVNGVSLTSLKASGSMKKAKSILSRGLAPEKAK